MAITVTVEINDLNEKILLNDLLDINDWVQKAVSGRGTGTKSNVTGDGTVYTVIFDAENFDQNSDFNTTTVALL